MTPGRTCGQAGCWGQQEGQDQAGQEEGCEGREHQAGVSGCSGAQAVRPPRAPMPGWEGARAGWGRALSPTASVMKDTWMKSDSQLSTYMNHMAPPPRPAPDRREGPARSGLDYREPPPPLPRPRPADGRTAVRRRREEPGPSAALAGSRVAPPAGAEGQLQLPREVRAGGSPGSRGCTEVGDATPGGRDGPERRRCGAGIRARKATFGPSLCTPAPAWRGVQGRGGPPDLTSPRTQKPQQHQSRSLQAGFLQAFSCPAG